MAGKTTFSLFSYVYQPLIKALKENKNIQILYFSFEMSAELLFAKLLSMYLWDNYGQIITFEEIMSLTNIVNEEKYAYICDAKAWLETIENYITVIDIPIPPQKCDDVLHKWNEKYGRFLESENGQETYINYHPEMLKLVITDHVKLIGDNGKGVKSTIDEFCNLAILYRNKCNDTFILIQQANRNFKGMDRRMNDYNLLQLDDTSDSSGTVQASEIVIGIFNPFREKLNRVDKYNAKKLGDRIRVIQILKNRYGQSDKNICVSFYGEVGWFKELPPAEEINDYEAYLDLISEVKSIAKSNHTEISNKDVNTLNELDPKMTFIL